MARILPFTLLSLAIVSGAAHAEAPPPLVLPDMVTLDGALKIFRERGLDLLIADAAVYGAEGDVRVAGAVPNPTWNLGYQHSIIAPGGGFNAPDGFTVGIGDNNAIEDSLAGKRGLRLKVARAALAAARLNRADAQRTLELQVKQSYIQAVQARDQLDFALEVQKATNQIYELNHLRYQAGAISEADEAKVEATKLESDQAVDTAIQLLRVAKISLAFLLGVRGSVPDYKVEQDLPKFVVPPQLGTATVETLLKMAYDQRPDLKAIQAQRERAQASSDLAHRARFPDIAFNFQYTQQGGTDGTAVQPPTFLFALSGTLPIFYLQRGEIQKAEADMRTTALERAKIEAQVVADVEAAFQNFSSSRRLVERMESRLLDRVKRARDLIELQYKKGAASLLEFLDAQRQYISTNVEYLQDLTNYWTAVFQLETAVGADLR